MGESNSCCCQKPEQLKGSPKDCSKEQIEKCHGAGGKHPCVTKAPTRGEER